MIIVQHSVQLCAPRPPSFQHVLVSRIASYSSEDGRNIVSGIIHVSSRTLGLGTARHLCNTTKTNRPSLAGVLG